MQRIPQLDSVRAVAIVAVFATHAFGIRFLWGGVDLFFVLSGFLIGGILMDHERSPRLIRVFYLRRAFRILPAYWLLLLTYVVVTPVDSLLRFGLLDCLYDPNPLPVAR